MHQVLLPLRATAPRRGSSNDGVQHAEQPHRVSAHDVAEPETCRHWQPAVACHETCACGHGCGEHHGAGWCSRCSCLVWQDAPEVFSGPASLREDDAWQLEEVFDEQEQQAYDDAAGF